MYVGLNCCTHFHPHHQPLLSPMCSAALCQDPADLVSLLFISSLQSIPKVLCTPSLAPVSMASSQSVPCFPCPQWRSYCPAHVTAWLNPGCSLTSSPSISIGGLCSHLPNIEISSLKLFFFHMAAKKHPNMARSQAVLPSLKADGSSHTCLCISK